MSTAAPAQEATAVSQIMVIPREALDRIVPPFQGYRTAHEGVLGSILNSGHVRFMPRPEMENDPSYKQLIPYLVLMHGDDDGRHVFAYRRTPKGGESRLHGRRSIGVGGHISPLGGSLWEVYEASLERELDEEVAFSEPRRTLAMVGLLNDDSNPVGAVHLGIVHVVVLPGPSAKSKEEDLADDGFYRVPDLVADRDNFETWSQLVLDDMATR